MLRANTPREQRLQKERKVIEWSDCAPTVSPASKMACVWLALSCFNLAEGLSKLALSAASAEQNACSIQGWRGLAGRAFLTKPSA